MIGAKNKLINYIMIDGLSLDTIKTEQCVTRFKAKNTLGELNKISYSPQRFK